MIRAVWLATICLAVLSTLAVGKALMTRADSPVAERPTDQATVGTGLVQDTLSKADRLEITYVRQEVRAPSALQPAELIVPAVSSVAPPVENKIISRHWRDPNAFPASATKQSKPGRPPPTRRARPSIEKAIRPRIALNQQIRRSPVAGPEPSATS